MTQATFTQYDTTDSGITLRFTVDAPGAGRPSEWTIEITDAELGGISTLAQFRTLVIGKLQRKVANAGIGTKLDPLLGQTVNF